MYWHVQEVKKVNGWVGGTGLYVDTTSLLLVLHTLLKLNVRCAVLSNVNYVTSRQPFWSSSAFMDWLRHICLSRLTSLSCWHLSHLLAANACACCLFRAHRQPMATGVLLSVDQSSGTVYLWHIDHVTSRRRLLRRHLKTFLFNCLDNYLCR